MGPAPRRRSGDLVGTYSVGERFSTMERKVDALDSKVDRIAGGLIVISFAIPVVTAVLFKLAGI